MSRIKYPLFQLIINKAKRIQFVNRHDIVQHLLKIQKIRGTGTLTPVDKSTTQSLQQPNFKKKIMGNGIERF